MTKPATTKPESKSSLQEVHPAELAQVDGGVVINHEEYLTGVETAISLQQLQH
jgi:hypothetical protein